MRFPVSIKPEQPFPRGWFIFMTNGFCIMEQRIHLLVWQFQNRVNEFLSSHSSLYPDTITPWPLSRLKCNSLQHKVTLLLRLLYTVSFSSITLFPAFPQKGKEYQNLSLLGKMKGGKIQ